MLYLKILRDIEHVRVLNIPVLCTQPAADAVIALRMAVRGEYDDVDMDGDGREHVSWRAHGPAGCGCGYRDRLGLSIMAALTTAHEVEAHDG